MKPITQRRACLTAALAVAAGACLRGAPLESKFDSPSQRPLRAAQDLPSAPPERQPTRRAAQLATTQAPPAQPSPTDDRNRADGDYGYGGYSGGYYDPYDPERSYPDPALTRRYEEGSLKLKIKPADADVFIDGRYVGVVKDFDGRVQKVQVEAGRHRIEIRAKDRESLAFNVVIGPRRTVTLRGALKNVR